MAGPAGLSLVRLPNPRLRRGELATPSWTVSLCVLWPCVLCPAPSIRRDGRPVQRPKMRSCTARFFRLASRPVCRSVQGDGSTAESSHVNEKQDPKPRRWSCILLMALRCFQLAYFVFAYYSLFGFRRSSFVGEGRPWLRSPDQMDRPTRTMRWVRLQVRLAQRRRIRQTRLLTFPGLHAVDLPRCRSHRPAVASSTEGHETAPRGPGDRLRRRVRHGGFGQHYCSPGQRP